MELVTVGTGTVAPSATRTAACHWVSRGALKILLDCGAGALHRLAEFGLPWHEVTHVVLSHFHPDHWGELPMLVYALKYTSVPARREPLVILGPPGVVRLVKALAPGYGEWLLDPGFPIGILDVRDGEPFPLPRAWPWPWRRRRGGSCTPATPAPRASSPSGRRAPTCCWPNARSPKRWRWTVILRRSAPATWPAKRGRAGSS